MGIIFFFGLIFGSFANVLIVRMKEESSLWGRSRCPHCRTTLRWHHLIPIASWIALKGRCAFCGERIHFTYPLVELISAYLALFAAWNVVGWINVVGGIGTPLAPLIRGEFYFLFFFLWWLLVCAAFDLRWKLLPLEFMGVGIVLAAAYQFVGGPLAWQEVVLGIVIGGGFFGLQYVLSKGRWVGQGDIWIGTLIGAGLGWKGVVGALYFAYIVGASFGIVALILGRAKRNVRWPMAPFLFIGSLLSVAFGERLMQILF